MSLCLLFLIVLTSVCFFTIFLIEHQPDEPKPPISKIGQPVPSLQETIDGSLQTKINSNMAKVTESRTPVGQGVAS